MALLFSLVLSLRLVGLGWLWGLATEAASQNAHERSFLSRLGRAVAIGLLLNLLPVLALASFGLWTVTLDWVVWGALSGLGILWVGLRRFRWRWTLSRGLAAVALVWLVGSVPLLWAPRSEWLAGGWDPGIYQNNAIAVARDGGLGGRTDSIYSLMTEDEMRLFIRSDVYYHEVFPGVPIRLEDGSLPLYFFHLTPLCGAWFFRMGGLALLTRMPAILALWGLFPALALFGGLGLCGWRRWVPLGFWLLSPLWWYQQAIPTTEMLYLLLLLSGGLLYLDALRRRAFLPLGTLAVLFAATTNHLNVAVYAGVLLLVVAGAEAQAGLPGRRRRMLSCFAAIGLAILWDLKWAHITILRLEEKDHALRIIPPLYGLLACGSLALAWRPAPARLRLWAWRGLRIVMPLLAGGILIVALGMSVEPLRPVIMKAAGRLPLVAGILETLLRLIPFHGGLGVALAAVGMGWMALDRSSVHGQWRVLTLALGLVCLLLLVEPGIAALYPWALRRFMVFTVPLLALTQAYAVVRLLEGAGVSRSTWWRWGVLAFALVAAIEGARISRAAARVGDYPGLGSVLATLEAGLRPDDVIVADDPRWGTPLLLAGGHDVISGRQIWQSKDRDHLRRCMEALQRLQRETGRRFLWLTCTEDKRAIYPTVPGGPDEALMEATPFAYQTVNHSSRASTYEVQPIKQVFRLYLWDGTFRWRDDGAPAAP